MQVSTTDGKAIDKKEWTVGDEIELIEEHGYFYLNQNDQTLKVKPVHSVESVRMKVARAEALWCLSSIQKGRFHLRSIDVNDAPTVIDLDIGISTLNAEQLFKGGEIPSDSIEAASQWMTDEFILEGAEQPRIFVSVYGRQSAGNVGNSRS